MKLGELRPHDPNMRQVNLDKIRSFEELRREGFTPFSVGPLYVYAGVQESLPSAFAAAPKADRPGEVSGNTIHFDRPIIARCEQWNFILDVMDTPSFQWFKKWMLGNHFASREKQTYYVSRHYIAPILDPLAMDLQQKAIPSSLDLFSVSGLKGSLKPRTNLTSYDQTKIYVDMYGAPPEEGVIVEGRKVLATLKGL